MFKSSPDTRFWQNVDKRLDDECWNWKGGMYSNDSGYGCFSFQNKAIGAHRFSYILAHGTIPDGLSVLHTCDNRLCVNPNHLYAGTKADNNRDTLERNRINPRRGEQSPISKMTESDVRAARAEYAAGGISYSQLAARYGVSLTTMFHAVKGVNWKHLK